MSSLIPLDRVVELIKNITDGIRCSICDKPEGARGRFECGHTGCDDCLSVAEGCVLCLSPPSSTLRNKYVTDEQLTKRVKSASSLLKACQDVFNIDVYKRKRISEKLKIEKDLFPECIQAPVKYCNMRKSLSSTNKENRIQLLLPGELISPPKQFKMKKFNNSVQQWLNHNESYSRRAFSELNVNQHSNNRNSNLNENILKSRKRIQSFSPVRKQKHAKLHVVSKQAKKHTFEKPSLLENKVQKKCEHDESGIGLDDEIIYIDDSQSEVVDKDKLALLAVEAADIELSDSTSLKTLVNKQNTILPQSTNVPKESKTFSLPSKTQINVPFYKKSHLLETCTLCIENNVANSSATIDSKTMLISIENSTFVTTIHISNSASPIVKMSSMSVQTDITDANELFNCKTGTGKEILKQENALSHYQNATKNEEPLSQDLFTDYKDHLNLNNKPDHYNTHEQIFSNSSKCEDKLLRRNVIIDDSDSDAIGEESSLLQVSADVHVSCELNNYDILNEIYAVESKCRLRKKTRGATPDSNNSSEKENCDPNKIKKHTDKKIKKSKK